MFITAQLKLVLQCILVRKTFLCKPQRNTFLNKHRFFDGLLLIVFMGLGTALNGHKTTNNYRVLVDKSDLKDNLGGIRVDGG